ncbi:MAG: Uncharacterized MFS-type transporter [uncultured Caballeronia sp.]|nr:MAG: Uncharacterized MFS-type transporter [uncultured Caballeronia sp.]
MIIQLDVTIVNVALVQIGNSLDTTIAGLQWVVDAYMLAFATLLMTGGAFGDRSGERRIFVSGFVVFALSSAVCGLARSGTEVVASACHSGSRGGAHRPEPVIQRYVRAPSGSERRGWPCRCSRARG